MAQRFYINSPLVPGPVVLEGSEAHHLAVVCRLSHGDQVYLFNGNGREYAARVEGVHKRRVELTVTGIEAPQRELPFRVEVAVPLPKADRASFLVEKLTELGVSNLVPLRTARSVVHPRETRLEKLQRTVIEASKQCGRNVLMRIETLAEWSEYCGREHTASRILAHPGQFEEAVAMPLAMAGDCVVAVGPEGGFTDEEVALALERGWRAIGLGPRVLRVETAAIVLAVRAANGG